ncbi:glycosyltransferase family A protein [Thioclava sp. GXIMD2076]|uniref:glycosyltransferase family A protein n=1 Tax=Thioclava sp. GXIMD2076 TaxID=3131931 RepID=UPI0030D4E7F7
MAEPNWFRYLKWRRRVAKARREIASRTGQGTPHGLPHRLVVSLTSFPPRYPALVLVLRSLLTQSITPDEVVLWLAEVDETALPDEIRALEAKGLTIRTCADWRSYKKHIPALLAYPEAAVVTFDDDVYYPRDWLERLVRASIAHPGEVIAHRAHRFTLCGGRPAPYLDWPKNIGEAGCGADIFLTGVHGVLYPPRSLHEDVTREDLFLRLAPTADDVWMYWMARMQGTLIRHAGGRTRVIEWPGTQEVSLKSINRSDNSQGNDEAIAAMMAHYGLPEPK